MAQADYQNVPLGHGEWLRQIADEMEVPLINRYLEYNPTNIGYSSGLPYTSHSAPQNVSLLSRPGLKRWLQAGDGPITNVYSCPGSFKDALFVASGGSVYRIDTDETVTLVGGGITADPRDYISMAATASLGTTPEYLFIAGGGVFYVYLENGYARATLQGTPANGDVFKIDTVYYQITNGSVDTGTPAGTLANPWLVKLGATPEASFQELYYAINASGKAGTDYSTPLTANATVQGFQVTSTNLVVRALTAGTIGNSLSVTATSSGASWNASTLTQGGAPMFEQVDTPDGVGIQYVVFLASFILAVVVGNANENGRFYWIEPGDIIITPLNFATAERSPDPIVSARVIGDQLYLFGNNSCEVWYANTAATDPSQSFLRVQGVTFDRGIWGGTDAQIRDTTFVVDNDAVVWVIENGQPRRVSNNAIEGLIREGIRDQINA